MISIRDTSVIVSILLFLFIIAACDVCSAEQPVLINL